MASPGPTGAGVCQGAAVDIWLPYACVTISSTNIGSNKSLDGPYSLAFDSYGDLWVENFGGNTTVEFGKGQLSMSGSPTPQKAIVGPRTGMNWPSYVVVAP